MCQSVTVCVAVSLSVCAETVILVLYNIERERLYVHIIYIVILVLYNIERDFFFLFWNTNAVTILDSSH